MAEIINIEVGQELLAERWMAAAENLETTFPIFAGFLSRMNHEGRGEEDVEELMADATLALIALRYVGTMASDKCRFIPIPRGVDDEKPKND